MCVILESESVVADILGRIDCLGHRTDSQGGQIVFLAATLYLGEHLVYRAVYLARCSGRFHLVSEIAGYGCEICKTLCVRLVMHAIYECLRFLALILVLADESCHGTVGQKHELLDELVGVLGDLEIHACRFSLGCDVKFDLGTVKINRAILVSLFAEYLGEAVEGGDCLHAVAHACLNHALCLLVAESAVGLDDGTGNLGVEHTGVGCHLEDDGEGQLLLVGTQ